MQTDQSAQHKAFLSHLNNLSKSLHVQVGLVRDCLHLNPSTSPALKEIAEHAVEKLNAAVCDFRSDLQVAAGSSHGHSYEKGDDYSDVDGTEFMQKFGIAGREMSVSGMTPPSPEKRISFKEVISHPNSRSNLDDHCLGSSEVRSMRSVRSMHSRTSKRGDAAMERRRSLNSVTIPWCPTGSECSTVDSADIHVGELISSQQLVRIKLCEAGVLNPQWGGKLAWDFMVIFLVLCDSMILPFQFAFKSKNDDIFDTVWLVLTTWLFGLDLVLNFFTAYAAGRRDRKIQEGTLITNKVSIAKHYLGSWFVVDLVSTMPWATLVDALVRGGSGSADVARLAKIVKLTRLLRLVRMLRLAKLGTIWERIEARLGSILLLQTVNLLRVLFVVVAICHWNACLWWMVGLPENLFTAVLSEDSLREYTALPHWTTVIRSHGQYGDDLQPWRWVDKSTTEAYVFCFYWTLGVMRTMPAEVTPVNLPERIFVLVFMFFAVCAFAICIARITQAYFKFSERRATFNEEMAMLRMHLRRCNAEDGLQVRIKTYLRHLFETRRVHAKEMNLLHALPEALRKKLYRANMWSHLLKMELMQGFPRETLKRICEIVEVHDFMPGDVVASSGMPATGAWILMSGCLQAIPDAARTPCPGDISTSELFIKVRTVDEECLYDEKAVNSVNTVIAVEASQLIRIDKKLFFEESAKDANAMSGTTAALTPLPTAVPNSIRTTVGTNAPGGDGSGSPSNLRGVHEHNTMQTLMSANSMNLS